VIWNLQNEKIKNEGFEQKKHAKLKKKMINRQGHCMPACKQSTLFPTEPIFTNPIDNATKLSIILGG
jgi:hypothetical protein